MPINLRNLRFSWLTWDDIDGVNVTNGLSNEKKMSWFTYVISVFLKISNMFRYIVKGKINY